jgi:hypothetical protein
MTKHYCDICEQQNDMLYAIDIYVHVKQTNHLSGHAKVIDGEFHPISGRTERTECCLICYNKAMIPLWDRINELKLISKL